jgi:hypothetical protein
VPLCALSFLISRGREASHCVPFLSEMFADRRRHDVFFLFNFFADGRRTVPSFFCFVLD